MRPGRRKHRTHVSVCGGAGSSLSLRDAGFGIEACAEQKHYNGKAEKKQQTLRIDARAMQSMQFALTGSWSLQGISTAWQNAITLPANTIEFKNCREQNDRMPGHERQSRVEVLTSLYPSFAANAISIGLRLLDRRTQSVYNIQLINSEICFQHYRRSRADQVLKCSRCSQMKAARTSSQTS